MRWKNCALVPAAGRRTQFFHLIFEEPGARFLAEPCIGFINIWFTGQFTINHYFAAHYFAAQSMECTRRCRQGQCVEKGECHCSTPVWQICGTNTCKYCQNLEECTDEGLKKSWDFRWIVESNLKADFTSPHGMTLQFHFATLILVNFAFGRGSPMAKLAKKNWNSCLLAEMVNFFQ